MEGDVYQRAAERCRQQLLESVQLNEELINHLEQNGLMTTFTASAIRNSRKQLPRPLEGWVLDPIIGKLNNLEAYEKLLQALHNAGQHVGKQLLQDSVEEFLEIFRLCTFGTPTTESTISLYSSSSSSYSNDKPVRHTDIETYPNWQKGSHKKRLALIINYRFNGQTGQRCGSDQDVLRLKEMFQRINYEVWDPTSSTATDLTTEQTVQELQSFAESPLHKEADSMVAVFMSHGKGGNLNENTLMETADSEIPSEMVISFFNNNNCPLLKGKPKMLLFQCCRGCNRNNMSTVDSTPCPKEQISYERANDDLLIVYSTLPGQYSCRSADGSGSIFIKTLVDTFTEDDAMSKYHVLTLVRKVDNKMKEIISHVPVIPNKVSPTTEFLQTTEIILRGFNKDFYFLPNDE